MTRTSADNLPVVVTVVVVVVVGGRVVVVTPEHVSQQVSLAATSEQSIFSLSVKHSAFL